MPTRSTRARQNRSRGAAKAPARIHVQRATRAIDVPSVRRLRAWARAACPPGAEVTVRVVGLREARFLNATFRRHANPTNVLSFRYATGPAVRGDIVLCHPVVLREARAQGKACAVHYAHLVVHGILHLRGFGHARRAAATRMEALERRILRRFGIADPYALRGAAPRVAR